MTRAERFMSVWIENNGYQYDNFPVGECMQSYADHQLKAKMPKHKEIEDYAERIFMDETLFISEYHKKWVHGAKWLKQQIIKP